MNTIEATFSPDKNQAAATASDRLTRLDRYWRAANYLTIGQIYLQENPLPWRVPVPSLNILLTSTCWRNDHNGFSHQGPGLIDTVLTMKGVVGRTGPAPNLHSRTFRRSAGSE